MLAFVGASAAIMLSDIPFPDPIAGVRVARVEGKLVINPNVAEIEKSDLDVIVAGSKDALVMVEGGASQVSEAEMIEALRAGHAALQPIIEAQRQFAARVGKTKREAVPVPVNAELQRRIEQMALERVKEASSIKMKKERGAAIGEIEREVRDTLLQEFRKRPVQLGSLAEIEALQAEGAK